MPLYLKESLVR